MKQYDSYKDSGVQWIGRIPSHWECASISHLTTSRSGGTPDRQKKEYWDNGTINWMSSGEVNKGMVYDTEEFITKLGSLNSSAKPLPKNSVMIALNGQGKTKGMAAVLKIKAACNQSLCAFSCDNRLHYMYLYYNFKSMYKYLRSQAGDDTRDGLAASFVKKQKIPLPPFTEQESIVNYIDKKCAEIDKAIATQQRRIELLQELRQNIITHAVTRGINPDVPLKDSGVEWIGMVPEHWEVMKMKLVCKVITDYVASGSFADLKKNVEYLDSPDYAMLVRTADLSNKNKDIQRVYVSKSSYDFLANSNLFGGEIILPNIGASIGDVYMVPNDLYDKMTLAPNSIMVKTKYCDLFYYYYFCSICGRKSLELIGMAAAQGKFNKTELRQMRVLVPPSSEQQNIIKYIEQHIAPICQSIEKTEHQISLLQELKQSIITEVVTGKRKVC